MFSMPKPFGMTKYAAANAMARQDGFAVADADMNGTHSVTL